MRRSREEIEAWQQGEVAPALERWGRRRKLRRVLRWGRFPIYGVVIGAGVLWGHVMIGAVALGVAILALEWFRITLTEGYSGAFAMEVVDPAVEFLYPGFRYDPHDGMEKYEYLGSNLFQLDSEFRSAHGLKGEVAGGPVYLSEVECGTSVGGGRSRAWRTHHRGWLLQTPQPGVGAEMVMIRPFQPQEEMKRNRSSFPDSPQTQRFPKGTNRPLSVVELGNEEFAEHFAVYGSSRAAAEALLHEEMVEALLELRRAPDPDDRMVFLAWFDECLYIARRHDRPLMTPDPGGSLMSPDWVEAIQVDVEPMLELVRLARKVKALEAQREGPGEEDLGEAPAQEERADLDLQWEAANLSDEW